MEYWFIIPLSVVAIGAIGILIFFELMGDDASLIKKKHRRGKYVNDQTAIIYQSIKDIVDSRKAYSLFVEYIFANNKQYLEYLVVVLNQISKDYNSDNIAGLEKCVSDINEMKIELKDQLLAQNDCISTIDDTLYIEAISWVHLSNDCRFNINAALHRLALVCRNYSSMYTERFPDVYTEQLEAIVTDINSVCDTCMGLIGTPNVQEMRELRKDMSVMLDESYTNSQRLFELIHDGRSNLSDDKLIALKYALNSFQELHGIIYDLRRFVLSNICITLSLPK